MVYSIKRKKLPDKYWKIKSKNDKINAIMLKTKEYFYNLIHLMEDFNIPKINNNLENIYSTMEPNYRNNGQFKPFESAINHSNCQILFKNFYKIEEEIYATSSPYSRAGLNHKDDDWSNITDL